MTGVIDIGGGLRGIFGTGVFDRCLDESIGFDYYMGVSAGAANIVSFLGKQKGRNLVFYTEYAMRPQYMSLGNLIKKGSYLDLDYVYGTLSESDGENPLDFEKLASSDKPFFTVTTNALTGEPLYFSKDAYKKDDYTILKASCCLPVACRPVIFDGIPCYDGGASDPVPVEKALSDGCERLVVIITRPKDERRVAGVDEKGARLLRSKYPLFADVLENRYKVYNESLEKAISLESEGRALIVYPDEIKGLKTLTKDTSKLKELYECGYKKAEEIKAFIK